MSEQAPAVLVESDVPPRARPRLGFLGIGWIGRNRMEAVLASGDAEVGAIADPSPEMRAAAADHAPGAAVADSLEQLLEMHLDGLVIATPSAMHASQSIAALEAGVPVFCQKPLGRTAAEVRAVVEAAQSADLLLGLDLSYRSTAALRAVADLVRSGELGEIFAADLVFHNAYGPDKPWFYDRELSGGGCVMDLGIHLVDALLWTLDFPAVSAVRSRLFAAGRPLAESVDRVEDYAVATLDLSTGAVAQLACSWNLPAGQDAVISLQLHGTAGGAAVRNVNGSFYDFVAERYRGTARETLVEPPDDWGGRAIVDWTQRLARGDRFDSTSLRFIEVAAVLDDIYGR